MATLAVVAMPAVFGALTPPIPVAASTTWSIVSRPNTSTSQTNYLNGVSCTSASACTAVGYYYAGLNAQTLIE